MRFLLRIRRGFARTIIWIKRAIQLGRNLADHVAVVYYGAESVCRPSDETLAYPKMVEV
jgi:hypothetical protein